MNVMIDTNVVLDDILTRSPNAENARIVRRGELCSPAPSAHPRGRTQFAPTNLRHFFGGLGRFETTEKVT